MALLIGSILYSDTLLTLPLQPPSFNWIYDWRSKSSKASKSTPRHQLNHRVHSQCKSAPAKRAKSAPVQIDHCFVLTMPDSIAHGLFKADTALFSRQDSLQYICFETPRETIGLRHVQLNMRQRTLVIGLISSRIMRLSIEHYNCLISELVASNPSSYPARLLSAINRTPRVLDSWQPK